MSDTEDHESRTEEASEKKVRDSIEGGKVPTSKDVGTATLFISVLISLSFVITNVGPRLLSTLTLMLGNSGGLLLTNGGDAVNYTNFVFLEMGRFLAPILISIMLAGLLASFMQGMPRFVMDRIMPDLSRISPLNGWSRLFGLSGLVELLKTIFKLIIVGGVILFILNADRAIIIDAMKTEPSQLPAVLLKLLTHMLSVTAIAVGIVAAADVAWTRIKWRRDIRMSRQELKDEHKQSEGDPLVKSRMRSLALDRSRKRMMAAIPQATLVITNPTHYAIALRFVREEGGAPLVVAKGTDLIALKIREVAEELEIPILERKELARSMYNHVEVDKTIPPEFFRPVAELIHYLSTMRKSAPVSTPPELRP